VAVARHFEQMDVEEEDCIGGFLERLEKGPTATTSYQRKTQQYPPKPVVTASSKKSQQQQQQQQQQQANNNKKKDKNAPQPPPPTSSQNLTHLFHNRKRKQWAARPGEQVAAKVTRSDENGSFILASVSPFLCVCVCVCVCVC
jgi:transcription initiation factor TFIID subunit TAF12